MGVASLLDLFNEKYYTGLEGGILEAFGKLFTKDPATLCVSVARPCYGPAQDCGEH
jgi:hypothetical protein